MYINNENYLKVGDVYEIRYIGAYDYNNYTGTGKYTGNHYTHDDGEVLFEFEILDYDNKTLTTGIFPLNSIFNRRGQSVMDKCISDLCSEPSKNHDDSIVVVDIETSGINCYKNGMLSLGAVELTSGKEFYSRCRLTEGREINSIALEINGFTEEEIKDKSLLSDVEVFELFVNFCKPFGDVILAGQNIGHLDILFLEEICSRSTNIIKFPFSHRTVDLHSVYYARYKKSLSHDNICKSLGIEPEVRPHNALNGAKNEAKIFKMLL